MKPYAIFTIVQNENIFLRLWANYYGNLSKTVDLFVLDDSTSDNSINDLKLLHQEVTIKPVNSGRRYDLERLRLEVQSFQKSLLQDYEVVIYTDVDEFLMTLEGGFFEYLENFRLSEATRIRASGWHCVHAEGEEPVCLKEQESVLKNRKDMLRLPPYDKVLISKIPIIWSDGFHNCKGDGSLEPDKNLVLFHAWMIDLDIYLSKKREYMSWSQKSLPYGLGGSPLGVKHDIPEHWKPLLHW